MKTITLEEHISTQRFLRAMEPPQTPQGAMADFVERTNRLLLDTDQGRIAAMDESGINMQVLSLSGVGLNNLDPGLASELAEEANEKMAEAVAVHPTRFAAFAAIAPQQPEKAAQELERWIGRGFKGTMIHGTVSGEFLDKPRFLPIFEAAQALDVPVYVHPARPPEPVQQAYFADLPAPVDFLMSTSAWGWHVETGLHALRLIVSGIFDKLPRLKIIIGHMGEDLPYSIARADAVLGTVAGRRLQRAVKDYFRENFWITTAGYFTVPPFLCAREVLGIDRLLFSVDYPYSPMENGIEFLNSLTDRIPEGEIAKLAWHNSQQLLRIRNGSAERPGTGA
jgi:predicted TIM-barrel fold metal-dependent hydrolase